MKYECFSGFNKKRSSYSKLSWRLATEWVLLVRTFKSPRIPFLAHSNFDTFWEQYSWVMTKYFFYHFIPSVYETSLRLSTSNLKFTHEHFKSICFLSTIISKKNYKTKKLLWLEKTSAQATRTTKDHYKTTPYIGSKQN